MNDVRRRRSLGVPLLIAAGIGLAAGVAGVYVTGWGAGNDVANRCEGARTVAERLKPLVRGEVAALIPAEQPADVSALGFFDSGKPRTLAEFSGKALLVNLWATWCVPCRQEMPALDRLQQARGGPRFEVVTVNVDVGDPEKPRAFLEEAGITALPDYRDPKMRIFNDLKAEGLAFGMPTTLLVDAQGCQVAALHGPAEWDSADAAAVVDAVVGSGS